MVVGCLGLHRQVPLTSDLGSHVALLTLDSLENVSKGLKKEARKKDIPVWPPKITCLGLGHPLSHLRKVETVSLWHVFAASCWAFGPFLGTRTVETMGVEHLHPGESRHLPTELPTYMHNLHTYIRYMVH